MDNVGQHMKGEEIWR